MAGLNGLFFKGVSQLQHQVAAYRSSLQIGDGEVGIGLVAQLQIEELVVTLVVQIIQGCVNLHINDVLYRLNRVQTNIQTGKANCGNADGAFICLDKAGITQLKLDFSSPNSAITGEGYIPGHGAI